MPTPPSACAVAVALPLTFDAFCADLALGPSMDYARGVLMGRTPEVAWRATAAPLAGFCRKVLAAAAAAGMTVVAEARLPDLRRVFASFQVVTILAHWRGAGLVADDVRLPPQMVAVRILAGADEVARALRERIPREDLERIAVDRTGSSRVELADLLASVVNSPRPLPGSLQAAASVDIIVDDVWLRASQRARLDTWWPQAFLPGNRLELRDGLHSPEAIAALVPKGWAGIVDFAICHSMLLAERVKAGQPERCVMMRAREVEPRAYLVLFRRLIAELRRGDRNYVTTWIHLQRALAASAAEELSEGGRLRRLRSWLGG